jgi:hypothetical protein
LPIALPTAKPTYSASTARATNSPPNRISWLTITEVQPGTGKTPDSRRCATMTATTRPSSAMSSPAAATSRSGRVPVESTIRQKWLSSFRVS